jgi:hypothetical protein
MVIRDVASATLRLLNPDFDSGLDSYSLLSLHQGHLRLDEPAVVEVEFFSYGVFESGQGDVFDGADFVPEAGLNFRSLSGVAEFWMFAHDERMADVSYQHFENITWLRRAAKKSKTER